MLAHLNILVSMFLSHKFSESASFSSRSASNFSRCFSATRNLSKGKSVKAKENELSTFSIPLGSPRGIEDKVSDLAGTP